MVHSIFCYKSWSIKPGLTRGTNARGALKEQRSLSPKGVRALFRQEIALFIGEVGNGPALRGGRRKDPGQEDGGAVSGSVWKFRWTEMSGDYSKTGEESVG